MENSSERSTISTFAWGPLYFLVDQLDPAQEVHHVFGQRRFADSWLAGGGNRLSARIDANVKRGFKGGPAG
jgi:hypothetical protein